MREYVIGINDAEQRLDRYLIKIFPLASSSYLQKMIRQKRIKLNKKRAEASSVIKEGDRVQIYIYEEKLSEFERKEDHKRSDIKLTYAFENEDLALIDKPAGLLSHSASPEDYGNNLLDAFIADLIDRQEYVPRLEKSFRPALVNRLDFNTEGLLLAGKSHIALMILSRAIQDERIEKRYLAYVKGKIKGSQEEAFFIDEPLINRDGISYVDKDGKEALTEIKTLWTNDNFSLLQLRLHTGRTHQIRAHLSHIGHPLLFDNQYGGGRNRRFKHHLLLSYSMIFHGLEELGLAEGQEILSARSQAFKNLRRDICKYANF